MISYLNGDILNSKEEILIHSVNHKKRMGAGLALQIARKYPRIMDKEESYMSMCATVPFSMIRKDGLVAWFYSEEDKKLIASIFGQENYGTDKQYTDYLSLGNGLETVRQIALGREFSVAIPFGLGCGLGGGDWKVVEDMIKRCFYAYSQIEVNIYKKD